MKLNTRVFELYKEKYRNLSELAQTMGMSAGQIYKAKQGKHGIDQKFIIGATRAFPGYNLDALFYVVPEAESSNKWPEFREYALQKYPNELDEDLITMIEDLIKHPPGRR